MLEETREILAITFAGSVQVAGVRCQQPKSTRCFGVAHVRDLLSTRVGLQLQPHQGSNIRIRYLLTPDTDLVYGSADHLRTDV